MAGTIADLLRKGRVSALFGRDRDLNRLLQLLAVGGPVVAYVHGPIGIGKTALLDAVAASFDDNGIRNVRLAAGATEPLPATIIVALAAALDATARTVAELATVVASLRETVVVLIDDVDNWRLAASWLRAELVPALPVNLRIVFAGNTAPPPQWAAEYGQHFLDIRLQPLSRVTSDTMVAAADLPPELAERIWHLTAGHPLALRMGLHLAAAGALDTVRDAGELANAILVAIGDAELRRAVEACAIVRRASRPLLTTLLATGEPIAVSLLEAIEALPFAARDAEGLYLVEPVRRAIIDWMSGVDAERYQDWRSIAAGWFVKRLRTTGREGRWRHMADLLDLLDEPSLRNAFFPTDAAAPPVEPARAADFDQILTIAQGCDGEGEHDRIAAWSERLPHRFSVARGPANEVLAFYLYARQDDPHTGLERRDPLFSVWRQHLASHPVTGEVLFVRQISARIGEPDLSGRIACVLDLKRVYIERPGLSRIYCYANRDDVGLLYRLGFRPLPQTHPDLPGTMVLEVPGSSIIDWVAELVDTQSRGGTTDGELSFVRDRREIMVDGDVVELTPLEAQVLARLIDRAPAVVGREEFIEHIWQRTYVGSNVVDTVVRTLRKKLGSLRGRVQTVPKTGYRYLAEAGSDGKLSGR
jgi:hypothetical protein